MEGRTFNNVGKLIQTKRRAKVISQSELSKKLGYKNGQFVSNIERGLCSIPGKKLVMTAEALNISSEELKNAVMKDYDHYLTACLTDKRCNNGE